ncbi:Chromosome partition protein Smc [Poriferisphaera corsica]|uniref:Chromosome partition protein Smc n=1 Tax=Poriferisphaera corsica TaxID=2528020 RepID=A0A517YUS0_9BACT|nr:hypothetical protein [Poriferisphaera corsica]QDU34003.1 Chromosome partition protein Smc [Poriferisphaera corsica]
MNERQEQSNTILEAWDILLQYRWRFILPAFIIMSGVLVVGFVIPRKYKAIAQFERRTDMVMTEIGTKGATRSFQDPKSILTEELKGQPAIDELFKSIDPKLPKLGIPNSSSDMSMLRGNVIKKVNVRWDISTNTIDRVRVDYVDNNPQLATLVVNTLIENYIKRSREIMNGRLNQTAQFFKDEVAGNRKKIEEYENNVLEFEIKYSELLPENPNNIQTKITTLQETLTELISEREAARALTKALKQSIDTEPEIIPSTILGQNPEYTQLLDKQRKLRDQYTEFTSTLKMKSRHPDMIALKTELAAIKEQLNTTPSEIVIERQTQNNPKLSELEIRLTTAQGEYEALAGHTAAMEDQLKGLQLEANKIYEVRSAYRKLQRQVIETERQITFWEDNLRRVEMALAAESGNKGIQLMFLKPASIVSKPVSPNWLQLIIAAVGMGIFCGALNVFVSHRTNDSFNDGEQASSFCDLQLFGAVSEIISTQQRKVRKIRNIILYPTNAIIMGSILLSLSTLLYLDLEKPDLFKDLMHQANQYTAPQKAIADDSKRLNGQSNVQATTHDLTGDTKE